MGTSVCYECPECSYKAEINDGAFFMSPNGYDMIMKGFYGKRFRKNLERHPGKGVFLHYNVYGCGCGNVRSKLVMEVYDSDNMDIFGRRNMLWSNAGCRCGICGKTMKERPEDIYSMFCPRCLRKGKKVMMKETDFINFD